MNAPTNEKSVFQHRGYSCANCNYMMHIYGKELAPVQCLNCGAEGVLSLRWNHIVTSTKTVADADAEIPA